MTEKYKYIEILDYEKEKVVKRMDVSNHSALTIEKIENGMNANLNHETYYTVSIESQTELPEID